MPLAAKNVVESISPKLITRFPFHQLTGGIIIIRACIDNYPDSLNFILDTGSGGISLDSTTVKYMGIPNEASDRVIRGIAGMRKVNFAYNHDLKLPGLSVDSLNFHINDYDILSGVYGLRIDGIIGYSFLRRYIVRIDYDKMFVEVFEPGMYKYPRGGYLMKPTIAGIPVEQAMLSDERDIYSRFYIDTGAGLCLLLSEAYCRDSAVIPATRKKFNTITEGLGGTKEMTMTVLKKFKIGPYKFRKVPVYIFDDEFNVTSYPHLGGLIGNDILRRFNVVINYPQSEFHLSPNSHFRDLFDYTYTGLGMYTLGDKIVIYDIIKDSPADQAGLKIGDVIVGVDNNLSNNIQVYKSLLQATGAKLRVIIKRDGELVETKLTVKSIL
jgi:hypothetical protein